MEKKRVKNNYDLMMKSKVLLRMMMMRDRRLINVINILVRYDNHILISRMRMIALTILKEPNCDYISHDCINYDGGDDYINVTVMTRVLMR